MIINKELIIANKKRSTVVADLRSKNFRPFPKVSKAHVAADPEDEEGAEEEVVDAKGGADSDYDYLLGMALYSLTAEKVSHRSSYSSITSSTFEIAFRRISTDERFDRSLNSSANETTRKPSSTLSSSSPLKISGTEISIPSPNNGMCVSPFASFHLPSLTSFVRPQALLEQDTINKNKSIRAAKSKGKGKKQVAHSDDDDSEDYAKPAKKAAAAPRAKPKPKAVPLPASDDEAPVKVAVVKEKAPAKAKPKAKPAPLPTSDDDEDVVMDLDSEVEEKKKPKKAPVKKVAVAVTSSPGKKVAAMKKRTSSVVGDADEAEKKPVKAAKKAVVVRLLPRTTRFLLPS